MPPMSIIVKVLKIKDKGGKSYKNRFLKSKIMTTIFSIEKNGNQKTI